MILLRAIREQRHMKWGVFFSVFVLTVSGFAESNTHPSISESEVRTLLDHPSTVEFVEVGCGSPSKPGPPGLQVLPDSMELKERQALREPRVQRDSQEQLGQPEQQGPLASV